MKNLKLFLACLILFIFFLPTNVNAQGQKDKSHYEYTFYSGCFGEDVRVVVEFNEFDNGKLYHYNVLKAEATGQTSGYDYIMIEVNNGREDNYLGTLNFRLIGPNGKKGFVRAVINNNKEDWDFYCF